MIRRMVIAGMVVLMLAFGVSAQNASKVGDGPKADTAPTLTTEQKQSIQILALRMENAQQSAKLAEAAFAAASTELGTLVRSLKRDGYELDLQTLTYAKVAAKTPTDGKKDGSQ